MIPRSSFGAQGFELKLLTPIDLPFSVLVEPSLCHINCQRIFVGHSYLQVGGGRVRLGISWESLGLADNGISWQLGFGG